MLKNKIKVKENTIVKKPDSENFVLQNFKVSIDNFQKSKAFENITERKDLKFQTL